MATKKKKGFGLGASAGITNPILPYLLGKVMQLLLKGDTQVYKQFVENEAFKRFISDLVYLFTHDAA